MQILTRLLVAALLLSATSWAQPGPEASPQSGTETNPRLELEGNPQPEPEGSPQPEPAPPSTAKGRAGPPGVTVNSGEDITRPVERFDLRINYEAKPDNAYQSQFTLRWDTFQQINEDDWVWYTRIDLPLGPSDTTVKSNQPHVGTFGLNDTLFQTYVLAPFVGNLGIAVGARFTLPTATEPNLGKQKWTVAPGMALVLQIPEVSDGSTIGLAAWNQFDYAGSANRDHINQLVLKPIVHFELDDGWFVQSQPEIVHYNLTGEWFVPLDLMVGRRVENTVYSLEYQRRLGGSNPSFLDFVEWRTGFFF